MLTNNPTKVSITIRESFRRSKPVVSTLVVPAVSAKKGNTKHYKRYHLQNEPLILEFVDNIVNFDGGKRSITEARQIASDVSKYMAFACDKKCAWESFTEIDNLKSFVEQLEKDGIGSDGITTKLERLEIAIKYILLQRRQASPF